MPLNKKATEDFIGLNQFEYHHTLAETPGIALVIFTRDGCGACRSWEKLLRSYQTFHPAIKLFLVDIESEPALAHELDIFHLPALFLYVNGRFHAEIQVEARLSRLEQAVQTALAAPAQEQP